jgi:dihydrolipoamide dehydrogenase
MKKYTAVILGGGPAGYTCAVRIAQLGGKVAIVERDFIGGICTNWGCTPSKSMIESAKIARAVAESRKYGINVSDYSISFPEVAARRDKIIRKSRIEIEELLKYHSIDVYQGEGDIVDNDKVVVKSGKWNPEEEIMEYTGEEEKIGAENIVIATGSKPLIPGFLNSDDPSIVSSNRLISIQELPKKLTIVGGGVIGLEFGTIFSNLGSEVTIVELMDRVMAGMDREISQGITTRLEEKGVRILTSHKVLSIENGILKAENQENGETVQLESPMNLIAIGRKAVVNNEAYDRLNLDYTDNGVDVNDYMQTNIPGIWSIGDATGKSILAHVGIQQGIICGENIMRQKKGKKESDFREMNYDVIPTVVYTLPEIAAAGVVPQDKSGVKSFSVPFKANLRANIEEYNEGFVKIWVKDDKLVAVQSLGFYVSEIIQELANMIELGTPIEKVANIIHAHPTYAEISRTVLEHALGRAIEYHE